MQFESLVLQQKVMLAYPPSSVGFLSDFSYHLGPLQELYWLLFPSISPAPFSLSSVFAHPANSDCPECICTHTDRDNIPAGDCWVRVSTVTYVRYFQITHQKMKVFCQKAINSNHSRTLPFWWQFFRDSLWAWAKRAAWLKGYLTRSAFSKWCSPDESQFYLYTKLGKDQ